MARKCIALAVFFLVFSATVSGQLISFDIAPLSGSESRKDAQAFMQALALSFGSEGKSGFILENQKISAGASIVYPVEFSGSPVMEKNKGALPVFFINYKVSDNLYFLGKMGSINKGFNIGQAMGYGLSVALGDPSSSSWFLSWYRSQITGLEDFRYKSFDFSLSRNSYLLDRFNISVEIGLSIFDFNMFSSAKADLGNSYESSRGYLNAEYNLKLYGINIRPGLRLNTQAIIFSVQSDIGL